MWAMMKNADSEARRTLIGAMLIKFSTGLSVIWGSTNIYFFSQLKHQGFHVDQKTNSILLLFALIPTCFAMLASNPLARMIGYRKLLRILAFLFLLSPLVINVYFNLVTFTIFWLIMPLTCFCLGAIPIINCLWTHFSKDLSKISGLAVLIFCLGMISWNLTFLLMVNPLNIKAQLDQNGLPIFPSSVSSQVFRSSNILFLIAGSMNVIGSFLITKRLPVTLNQALNPKSPTEAQIVQNNTDILVDIDRAVSNISSKSTRVHTLNQGLKDIKFIIVFLISSFMPIYVIYLNLNLKLIYMPIINDDHFLSYCSAIITASAIIGAPLWGYIGDIKGFKPTLMALVIFDTIVKYLGVYCNQKWSLLLLFLLIGTNDKGMLTIVGPGLIGMFGIEIATELIPYKGLAVFFGYIIAPLSQVLFASVLSYQQLLLVFSTFSLLGCFLTFYLNYKIHYKAIDPSKDYQMAEK